MRQKLKMTTPNKQTPGTQQTAPAKDFRPGLSSSISFHCRHRLTYFLSFFFDPRCIFLRGFVANDGSLLNLEGTHQS